MLLRKKLRILAPQNLSIHKKNNSSSKNDSSVSINFKTVRTNINLFKNLIETTNNHFNNNLKSRNHDQNYHCNRFIYF